MNQAFVFIIFFIAVFINAENNNTKESVTSAIERGKHNDTTAEENDSRADDDPYVTQNEEDNLSISPANILQHDYATSATTEENKDDAFQTNDTSPYVKLSEEDNLSASTADNLGHNYTTSATTDEKNDNVLQKNDTFKNDSKINISQKVNVTDIIGKEKYNNQTKNPPIKNKDVVNNPGNLEDNKEKLNKKDTSADFNTNIIEYGNKTNARIDAKKNKRQQTDDIATPKTLGDISKDKSSVTESGNNNNELKTTANVSANHNIDSIKSVSKSIFTPLPNVTTTFNSPQIDIISQDRIHVSNPATTIESTDSNYIQFSSTDSPKSIRNYSDVYNNKHSQDFPMFINKTHENRPVQKKSSNINKYITYSSISDEKMIDQKLTINKSQNPSDSFSKKKYNANNKIAVRTKPNVVDTTTKKTSEFFNFNSVKDKSNFTGNNNTSFTAETNPKNSLSDSYKENQEKRGISTSFHLTANEIESFKRICNLLFFKASPPSIEISTESVSFSPTITKQLNEIGSFATVKSDVNIQNSETRNINNIQFFPPKTYTSKELISTMNPLSRNASNEYQTTKINPKAIVEKHFSHKSQSRNHEESLDNEPKIYGSADDKKVAYDYKANGKVGFRIFARPYVFEDP